MRSDLERRLRTLAGSGRNWEGVTGALMYQALGARVAYPTVNAARAASTIRSTDASEAPAGAVHWFESQYGQAAIDLDGGGTRVVTASRTVSRPWGGGIGTTTVRRLSEAGRYLGWSWGYGAPDA